MHFTVLALGKPLYGGGNGKERIVESR